LDAPRHVHAVDEPVGATVDVVAHEHVVAGGEHRAQQRVFGGETRGEAEGALAALERGELRLERGARRVPPARILVAASEAADAVLHERRREVQRRDDGTGRRVELLPVVDRAGGEVEAGCGLVGGHRRSLLRGGAGLVLWRAGEGYCDRKASRSCRVTTAAGLPSTVTSRASTSASASRAAVTESFMPMRGIAGRT